MAGSRKVDKISFHEAGQNKLITLADNSCDSDFQTDRILLQRVITNMLKNALEATPPGGSIIAGVDDRGDKIRLRVGNRGVIPHDIQMQIFNRSFSTKGMGRGIGTYSIRLLTENYLMGKVSFVSNENQGTVFRVDLNKLWTGF